MTGDPTDAGIRENADVSPAQARAVRVTMVERNSRIRVGQLGFEPRREAHLILFKRSADMGDCIRIGVISRDVLGFTFDLAPHHISARSSMNAQRIAAVTSCLPSILLEVIEAVIIWERSLGRFFAGRPAKSGRRSLGRRIGADRT
jgi:hypothetical protein